MECLLATADILWSSTIVFPLTVLYWSATWRLIDIYLLPSDAALSNAASLVLGVLLCLLAFYILPVCRDFISENQLHSFRHFLTSKVIVYVLAWGRTNLWRGLWHYATVLIGLNVLPVTLTLAGAQVVLVLLKGVGSVVFTPFLVTLDTREDFYHTYPRFRTTVAHMPWYIADTLFTVCVMVPLAVIVWKDLWVLADLYIYPDRLLTSYLFCLGLGYGLSLVLHGLRWPVRQLAIRLSPEGQGYTSGYRELIVEDLYKVLTTVVGMMMWRGGWGLMKDFVLVGDNIILWCWLCHGLSMGLMMALQVASTMAEAGCCVDGEGGPQNSLSWSLDYFQAWWRNRHDGQTSLPQRQRHLQITTCESEDEERQYLFGSSPLPRQNYSSNQQDTGDPVHAEIS